MKITEQQITATLAKNVKKLMSQGICEKEAITIVKAIMFKAIDIVKNN